MLETKLGTKRRGRKEAKMKIGISYLRGPLLAGLALVGLLGPAAASASEQIRILVLAPRDAGALDIRVSQLEQAIRTGTGPLKIVDNLSDAHVVVQFTDHRRRIGDKGEPMYRWIGEIKLLRTPKEMTVSETPLTDHFELVVIGDEGKEAPRAAKCLEQMLTRAFRSRTAKPAREAL
jgi:hypothetical protein